MKISRVLGSALAIAAFAYTTGASAASFAAATDKFSYSGTIGGVAISGYVDGGVTYTGRDGSLTMSSNAPFAGQENLNLFLTAWYYTLTPANGLGDGNPNNQNPGFVQLYDETGATRTSVNGGWTDSTYRHFAMSETGANADYGNSFARLDGPAGTFTTYSLVFTADFLNPATETMPGWFSTDQDPTNVGGSFTGHFVDVNGAGVDFALTFGNANWAFDNAAGLGDQLLWSYFGADAVAATVPLPGTLALTGLGLLGIGWRNRRSRAAT